MCWRNAFVQMLIMLNVLSDNGETEILETEIIGIIKALDGNLPQS